MVPARPVDAVCRWLIAATLAGVTLAFGGVVAEAHVVLLAVAAALLGCVAMRCVRYPEDGVVGHWALLPGAAFVGLVALQTWALPDGWLAALAPMAASFWQEAGAVVSPAAVDRPSVSLYPHATAVDLRLLCAGFAFWIAAMQLARIPGAAAWLLAAVASIGAGAAAMAVLQGVTESRALFGLWPHPAGEVARGGVFVHRGHFAQFANLATGAAAGLLLARLVGAMQPSDRRIEGAWSALRARADGADRALLLAIVLGIVAVALSHSRNGVLSLVVAALAVAFAMQRSGFLRGIGWPLAGLAVVAGALLWLVGFDPVYERLSTLQDPVAAASGRLALLRDALSLSSLSPWVGVGLGAFGLAFPPFDTSTRPGTAEHAENQYVEILCEVGWVGAALLAAVLVAALLGFQRVRRGSAVAAGMAYGIGFGLAAVLLHALTDFGLRVPAVALVTTLFVGLLLGGAARPHTGERGTRIAGVGLLAAAIGIAAMLPAAWDEARAERAWRAARVLHEQLAPPDFLAPVAELDRLLAHADAAAARSERVDVGYWRAAHGWHRAVALAVDFAAGDELPEVPDTPELRRAAADAQRALAEVRRRAPTHGPSLSLIGQLGVQWLDDPAAGRHVLRARALWPHDPGVCAAAGEQRLRDGDLAGAVADYRRALAVGADWDAMLFALLDDLHRPDVARLVAAGDARRLLRLEYWWSRAGDAEVAVSEELRAEVRAEALGLVRAGCEDAHPPSWMLAAAAQLSEDIAPREAVDYYRRYFAREPSSALRIRLAGLLERLGEGEEARAEARRLLRFHPGHRGARAMLRE